MRFTLLICVVLLSCTRNEVPHLLGSSTFLSPITKSNANKSFDPSTLLWYTNPANEWEEALPVGNGRLGAMVFGAFELDLQWKNGAIKTVGILSKAGADCKIGAAGLVNVSADGNPVQITKGDGYVEFPTEAGQRNHLEYLFGNA